jgi:hypothetical protein
MMVIQIQRLIQAATVFTAQQSRLNLFSHCGGTPQAVGRSPLQAAAFCVRHKEGSIQMGGIIYLVGLVVVVMAVLSLIGLG